LEQHGARERPLRRREADRDVELARAPLAPPPPPKETRMKAHDQSGLELEVYQCGEASVRDAYWHVYTLASTSGEEEIYADGTDVIYVDRCECDAGLHVDPHYDFVCIQRCDICARYESDEDACAAHAAALNRAAGALHFEYVKVRVEEEEIDDERSYRAGIGLRRGDARGKELGHDAFRAECVRLGIDGKDARALDDDEVDEPDVGATDVASGD
jgi:hypothetical protein